MAQIGTHPPLSPEMIEHAAEAMWVLDHKVKGDRWDSVKDRVRYEYLDLARAALETALPEAVEAESQAARDVIAERQRQISEEGYAAEHDDQHVAGEMADAAACYAAVLIEMRVVWDESGREFHDVPVGWPRSWSFRWWKPKDRRRDLVRAGALIIAEIERLDRARSSKGEGDG